MKLASYTLGQGKPLVIIHGLFGFSDNWQTIAKQLSQSHEIHLLDMRNHGRSPHSEAFNYQVMVEDVIEYMDEQQWDKVSILGHSMGGKVAMFLAMAFPERLDQLIVVDIGPKKYPIRHDEVIRGLYNIKLQKVHARKDAEEMLSEVIDNFGLRQFLLKNLYRTPEGRYQWRMNLDAIVEHIDEVGQGLPSGTVYAGPALFIKGETSDYIEIEDWEQMLKHFPQAGLATIPGAGHWVHADNAATFFQEVQDFLLT